MTTEPEPMAEDKRRCIASGEVKEKVNMVRFVVGPDNEIFPDVAATLPGRGIWLTAERDAFALAIRKNLFSRAAKTRVKVADDLTERVEALLAKRCMDYLGFARRAGEVITGFDKVKATIEGGNAFMVLTAVDGKPNGREKVERLARSLPFLAVLTVEEMSLALGRENAVHVALLPGTLAEKFRMEADRLIGFRPADTAPQSAKE